MTMENNESINRLRSYVELDRFETEELASRVYIMFEHYNIRVHIDDHIDYFSLSVPYRDFEFCREVYDSIKSGRFDYSNKELKEIMENGLDMSNLTPELKSPGLRDEMKRPFSLPRIIVISIFTIIFYIIIMIALNNGFFK